MNKTGVVLLLALATATHQHSLNTRDIVVVVISQGDGYHSGLAQDLRDDLHFQATALNQKAPLVRLTHEEFSHPGAWTVVPLLHRLYELDGLNSSWIVLCEERTRFNLNKLLTTLSQHDHNQEVWIGHGLVDQEPTIIHHFAFTGDANKFQYPLLPAGFAISKALLRRLSKDAATMKKSDFSIDSMYELAVFVQSEILSLPNIFCLKENSECAVYPLPFTSCGPEVPNEDIFFAVKTCLKHHSDRVPVVKQTWAQHASNIEFFSDVQDESIPTTAVGVVNTARGHCAKTMVILKTALERARRKSSLAWVVLADDDTLLSVPRLTVLLRCWHQEPVVVGERYGYHTHSPLGYNYPTGGGGVVISTAVLPIITEHCACQADNSPDDMFLGLCLAKHNITLVHSPFFHQARPADYSPSYLATQLPVSFHKHWMLDPVSTYHQWFSTNQPLHTEL